jgi:[calcium/calmodulin-dependent protein kinase] kinase
MTCRLLLRSLGCFYALQLDIWALGVTVFMWMFGQLPFNGAVPFLIYECIRRQDMRLPDVDFHVSMELKDFLKAVLEKVGLSHHKLQACSAHAGRGSF